MSVLEETTLMPLESCWYSVWMTDGNSFFTDSKRKGGEGGSRALPGRQEPTGTAVISLPFSVSE